MVDARGEKTNTDVPWGYSRQSLVLTLVVVATGTAAGVIWREYVSLTWADFDPLLVFCWLLMLALAAWRFDARRDVPLAAVAFVGGAMIETWGTRSGLWTYFTHEKPPLFILPAWPMAALATERIGRVLERFVPRRRLRLAHAVVMLAFSGMLWSWTEVGRAHPTTLIAYAFVVVVCVTAKAPREDLVRFAAGVLLGWLLEYWGTTRLCWTYWDGKTPPLTAVFSHGFATVAFARGVSICAGIARRVVADDRGARAVLGGADAR
jgi:hypothetical protein